MCRSLLPDWTGEGQDDGLNYLRLPERQSKITVRKQRIKTSTIYHASGYCCKAAGAMVSFTARQKLSALPRADPCDAADCQLQQKPHPSRRTPLVPGPQVADNSLIIGGLRSIQLRCICGQGDDDITSNLCNWRLVYL